MTAPTPAVLQCAPEAGRAHNAAYTARTLFPGPIGEQLCDDLIDWANGGWRYDQSGRGMALIVDIETRGQAKALGRTHP